MQYSGSILEVDQKYNQSGKGNWKYVSRVRTQAGWLTYAFNQMPPFSAGDVVSFEYENNGKGDRILADSVKVSSRKAQREAARPASAPEATTSAPPVQVITAKEAKAVDWDLKNRQIVMQHSQEMAISAVSVLLTHGGLPVSAAETKAGKAKRFAEVTAMIDKLTVKFYQDAITGRLLDVVADTVPETAEDSQETEGDEPASPPSTPRKRAPKISDPDPEPQVEENPF